MNKLMLCSEYDSKYWSGKKFIIEEKVDGMRAYAIKTPLGISLYSRDNHLLKGFDYITDDLRFTDGDAYIIDGEIVPREYKTMTHMECFEAVSHINTYDNPGYILLAFDIIPMLNQNPQECFERHAVLKNVVKQCEYVKAIEWLYGGDDLHMIEKSILWAERNKKEGIVIKDANSLYEQGRSKSWQKIKVRSTIDATIIGVNQGSGKYSETCGSILCEAKHPSGLSVKFTCGTGMSDHIRDYFWKTKRKLIGMNVEIFHSGFTRNAVRHPVFKTLK